MSGQQDLAWETQDGVRSLQAALNSQPPVPMPLASWDTNTNSIPKLEGLDTIDLSTAPLMRSSPPVARPTILPQHSYYGGQVCPSCRAFFRRSVQSGYNATYFCVKDGNCEVTLKTRKNCQYCRYKLCEAAGMKT